MYKSASGDENLSAKVPLLESDDGVLIESMVILEYLEDVAPSTLTPAQRARARLFATLFPGRLSSFGILKADAGSDEEATAVEKLRTDLRAMDAFLSASDEAGPYLHGGEFSYAEYAAAPFAQRLAIVLPGLRPALGLDAWWESELPRLAKWMEAVCSRPSCVDSLPPAEEMMDSYTKMVERIKAMAPAA